MRILVTGATGLVGRRLVKALLARGETVLPVSRKALASDAFGPGSCEPVVGDPTQAGPWLDAISTCDAIVHLAGEPIFARRWSNAFRQLLRSSRVESTKRIAEVLSVHPQTAQGTARIWVSGSAVGYYGADRSDESCFESSLPGTDFMAELGQAWEAATTPASSAGVRVCMPRTGIVLDPEGGAMPRMTLPFRLFGGGRIAGGRQFVSWIHRDDMTALLLFALDHPLLSGPFNATAPNPVTNREFSACLARVLHRPNWLPVPRFALRVLLGPVAEVVVGGQRVIPQRLRELGFPFQYPELEPALRNLLHRESSQTG
jgi:uncharacterized protein (TIGR01777 family)